MSLIAGRDSRVLWDGDIPGPHGFVWGFVALEYYALVLNRLWVLLITNDSFVAVNAGGPIAAPLVVSEAWHDPFSYVSDRRIRRYEFLASQSDDVLRVSRANWKCSLSELSNISFTAAWKWGMGTVPYSGRLFVTAGGRRHDYVLVGQQDGSEIEKALRSGVAPDKPLPPFRGG